MSITRAIFQGCGAETVIFFLTVLSSAVIFPAIGKYCDHVITVLVALGAACLTGDAIFHLLPHALHHHDDVGTTESNHSVLLWRSFLVLCSIYFFYLFHLFFQVMEGVHAHSHVTLPDPREAKGLLEAETKGKRKQSSAKMNKTLIGMMLLGEVLHTSCDGLAIGAAFSKSAGDGLSTTLAVLFHEVPHAVGTFAIFISSGLCIRRALGLLCFCYLCAYAGVLVGATLSTSPNLTPWIFAVVAGMFLYVALAEMVPEMFTSITSRSDEQRQVIFLQNLGLLIGFAMMMTLAAFEETIRTLL
ncbi:zinc transporter ZIP12-like [Stylophora pistillata]|uniref:zinc transporter ZIP12-like n=1 Tax=Stylophora pistillata TaxID=50429 RepID=UPI000C057BA6|nr:zinc transporter ZIP12-like [Stylophora pistillata]